MTHESIASKRLLPRKVLVFCSNLASDLANETWRGRECDGDASLVYVANGLAISAVCKTCADRDLPQLQRVDPETNWHTVPLYHDDPNYPDQTLDRKTGKP